MAPDLPPPTELATAVRLARWAEVRTLAAAAPHPLPPAVALAAARAARLQGDFEAASNLLRSALPQAGELAAALRLEASELLLSRSQDPWPFLQPLLGRGVPKAHQDAAAHMLRRAFQTLPLAKLAAYRGRPLPTSLRRALSAHWALRTQDRAAALRFLREYPKGGEATAVARWLAEQPELPPSAVALVGEVLLAGGFWREADALLATRAGTAPAVAASRLAYLCGRAAYRLGRWEEARRRFEEALAAATDAEARFTAAVQGARTAQILGEWGTALELWEVARQAAPGEVEGWDGCARLLVATGRAEEAVTLLGRAPPAVLPVAGPRAVAALLARGRVAAARTLLQRLPQRRPQVRLLALAAAVAAGRGEEAQRLAVRLLADPQAGAWRGLVFDLLPAQPPGSEPALTAKRSLQELAATAVARGPAAARHWLAQALAADPAWAPLLGGPPPLPATWGGPAAALVAVGLDTEAATLYPHRFPTATPAEMAWSAAALASWGNGPAALSLGERLWAALGGVPAELVPDPLLPLILPEGLAAPVQAAAAREGANAAWLAAVIRRESRFDRAAHSPAGAVGVAQLVPETGRRLGATPEELWDGQLALTLAAREVARLARWACHRLPLVAGAYNAGEDVVASWYELLDEPSDPLFVAAIPYQETLGYVLAVREGAALARHLAAGTAPTPR